MGRYNMQAEKKIQEIDYGNVAFSAHFISFFIGATTFTSADLDTIGKTIK
jgi:hypothetical protein